MEWLRREASLAPRKVIIKIEVSAGMVADTGNLPTGWTMPDSDVDDRVSVRVPAKVNLALLVGETDEQGYHELGTIFQAVSLYDDIEAEAAPAGEFTLENSGVGQDLLPTDAGNLAVRAAQLLASTYDVQTGVRLRVHKRIPVAGGMAGGSADAAGVLLACSVLWDVAASQDELTEVASRLGADVPFPLVGGVAIGRGRGDQLVPLLTRRKLRWVFATSHSGLSTPEVFRRHDELRRASCVTLPESLLTALGQGDIKGIAQGLVNDLQEAALDLNPSLAGVLETGRAAGALAGLVSGSGPTCGFLVATERDSLSVADALGGLPQVDQTHRVWGPVPGAQVIA